MSTQEITQEQALRFARSNLAYYQRQYGYFAENPDAPREIEPVLLRRIIRHYETHIKILEAGL